MGLLAQLFRHKTSPPREHATPPEPDADADAAEVPGVGAVAAQIRMTDTVTAQSKADPIPGASPQPAHVAAVAANPAEPVRTEISQMPPPAIEHPPAGNFPAPAEQETRAPAAPPPSDPVAAAPAPESAPEISAPAVTLPPSAPPEVQPPVAVAATEQAEQPRELRPEKDVAISTTLRAVVLGGAASPDSPNAPDSAGQVLAPRITVTATATPVPLVLGPSVIPSANGGGILLAPRTAPDFAALQKLFMTNASLDLAGVAALAASLPGVRACVISGTAGDATAGDFSHGVSAGEMRAASANVIRRAAASMETLHRGESEIAIFLHGETCIAAVAAGGFVPGVRERLARAAELLAGAQPAR